jgi:hypothetical protein
VTWQLETPAVPDGVSAHDPPPLNDPEAEVKLTLPVGVVAVAASVSLTLAVHAVV